MIKHAFALFLALALTAALAGPASAAPPRSAQAFVTAIDNAEKGIATQADVVRERFAATEERCGAVLDDVPKRRTEDAITLLAMAMFSDMFQPTMPHLHQLLADLDAVKTRDRALRSGRAAWRSMVKLVEPATTFGDACGALHRWRARGWSRNARPPELKQARRLMAAVDDTRGLERKLDAAERRLRRLGIPQRQARRFDGDDLFDGLEDAMDDMFEESTSEFRRR